jgi:hypothetical protein
MKKKSVGSVKKPLVFSEDYVWMSYRYCIGRHTIAAHYHATTIAQDVYGKLSDGRMEFYSEDICSCIYDQLHFKDFIDFGWYGNIPKMEFKPLDVIYRIFDKENIDCEEKMRSIKTIAIDWNKEKSDFDYSIYYFNENDKNKDYGRSMYDIGDLEIWQKLANLFDRRTHKYCRLTDDTICEYYECMVWSYDADKKWKFKKYKCPVNRLSIGTLCYIPEENIKEDNVEPNNE